MPKKTSSKNVTIAQAQKKIDPQLQSGSNPMDSTIFQTILDGDISVKKMKALKDEMDTRLGYIIHMIHLMQGSDVNWYDYANEGGEDYPGSFDHKRYAEETEYTGSAGSVDLYEDYFPTEWFYTNFEQQLFDEIQQDQKESLDAKISLDAKQQALKAEQTKLWKSLTKEQRKLVYKVTDADLYEVARNMK